jgi:hypothetical protein
MRAYSPWLDPVLPLAYTNGILLELKPSISYKGRLEILNA